MESTAHRAIAIVGLGAILPDAPDVNTFWSNVQSGRDSISEVPSERWDPNLYYDPDPSVPDKTYSKIGGWVRQFNWDPMKWHLPLPPKVSGAMDPAQRWAIACTREALADYGFPDRPLETDRTAVILGNAMAGEMHYMTALRVFFPMYAKELATAPTFAALPEDLRVEITRQLHERVGERLPEITEDSMPGELANCIAGRIANLYNFHGPNYVVDAACASAMGAMNAAIQGLVEHQFDVAVTGGIDRNMGASTFVKFCKIGALSATGSRPYAAGADGFVMGEGAVVFLLKRLEDAERDGDKVYAVLRGIGGSSDGKGKGITAPNPVGQILCTKRAWENAGLSPADVNYIEGHGTSTRVGDVVEVQSMIDVLSEYSLPSHSIPIGSVKSNIGHLKAAAGAAGILKTVLALHHKVLPPSVHCDRPTPDIDFANSPLFVNTKLRPWEMPPDSVRRAGVSAFGFGGTNFHTVLEEYIPGRLKPKARNARGAADNPVNAHEIVAAAAPQNGLKAPMRGVLVLGAASKSELKGRLRNWNPEGAETPKPPLASDLQADYRIAIDYGAPAELKQKIAAALKAFDADQFAVWKALRAQGIFHGQGPAAKVAFLYTGQGSQYVNMFRSLKEREPIVTQTFAAADRVLTPLLGKPLTEYIFVDSKDEKAVEQAELDLRQTAITQPAVLCVDLGITRLLDAYGIRPDMTMGHSLGEYGALVASGCLPFEEALEAVSARGREMTRVSVKDKGKMAAVFAPLFEVERLLKTVAGYVEIANLNSEQQSVIGGASDAVDEACTKLLAAGFNVVPLPVSHAFHTSIVAPASGPMRDTLERMHLQSPQIPIVANVNGEFYPTGPNVIPQMLDILAKQIASPVQFIKGLQTLYRSGARIFVEVGPKKALHGFAEDVLGKDEDVLALFTNHPKWEDTAAFNQALCGLYAAGLGRGRTDHAIETVSENKQPSIPALAHTALEELNMPVTTVLSEDRFSRLGHLVAEFLDRASEMREIPSLAPRSNEPIAITGAALGLPGTDRIFDDSNIARLLRGDQFIDVVPNRFRRAMVDRHIRRLVKRENGDPTFETIEDVSEAIKLAGRGGAFDLEKEFGVPADRVAAFDRTTALALGAGIDALRDAGIPLVMRYKTTSTGSQLPEHWALPDAMRDDTGIIFASAFPGSDSFAEIMGGYYDDRLRREQLQMLRELRQQVVSNGHGGVAQEIDRRITELAAAMEQNPYSFERRFLLRVLSMGHSQLAEYIGARGPNTQINAACASTTQAVSIAEDWIGAGRCRRVLIVSADDVTSDNLLPWFGSGFLASGVAATDDSVEKAALPFDRRRHGMIIGMGAASLVVESAAAAKERGILPICEVLSTVTRNSAFHATRLDVQHIGGVMDELLLRAEASRGIRRKEIAPHTVFVSHETYTPARGGSASAEVFALRKAFGETADQVVIANTKGFTGHAMATGIEDVLAVKTLETGCVPPVANFREIDPELGALNLSRGGSYPIEYALRLGAGFGSQISMSLLRWVKSSDGLRATPSALGFQRRIADREVWSQWLEKVANVSNPDLEVVNRTLRIRDSGAPAVVAVTATKGAAVTASQAPQKPVTVAVQPIEPPKPQTIEDPVRQRILQLVADKTGYPSDMLALDLDLEADLGVDTVKQAEVFAAIREQYNIPRRENLRLRDFPTLAHVIQFVYDNRPDLSSPAPVAPTVNTPAIVVLPLVEEENDEVKDRLLELVVEKTGYPKDMLEMDLDLEADLGVDTVKQAELFAAIREIYSIPRQESLRLRDFPTLKHVVKFVYDMRPDLAQNAPVVPKTNVASPASSEQPTANAAVADSITDRILDMVVEKTGYPKDMLDLELDLEADLGVDTVKQAEMFAAIRSIYNIPRDENLKLRDFPTLKHVIQFARERSTIAGPAVETPVVATQAETALASKARSIANFAETNLVPRRVPVPVLRPPLELCKPTGVVLGTGTRVIVMPDTGGVAVQLIEQLRALDVEVLTFDTTPDSAALDTAIQKWSVAGPIQGVYWLSALDFEGTLTEISSEAWRNAIVVRVKLLYRTMRALYEQFASPSTFLVSATRLGGQHGYDSAGALSPMGGAVAGFTKAFKRERMNATVKAVDFGPEPSPVQVAESLISETRFDPGAVEIGYKQSLRWTIGLHERPAEDGGAGLELGPQTVFLVTGAAGSIVSAITADLAAASGGIFYLLDLVPKPDPINNDLKQFAADKEGLKRTLATRLSTGKKRATPAMVEKALAELERQIAAQSAIDAVQSAGGVVHYHALNLTDEQAVEKVIDEVRKEHGRIDVLLHAAGLERSHFLPDKEPKEFDLVFDVKADGFFHLLHAIGEMPVSAVVAFSSIAGRFGNGGQTDYSSANDLLCKIVSSFRSQRSGTRGIAIDWTAWDKIGMASRGSIPKMMEIAGIDMLDPQAGIPLIRRELTMGATRGEVVAAKRLGMLLDEFEATGGLDLEALENSREQLALRGPMVGKITGMGIHNGLTMETQLDPIAQPFLNDHRIDGTPVLPGVMGIEAFAEAALCVHPGWHIEAIEEVNFLAPFKFYKDEPRTILVEAVFRQDNDHLITECRLIGRRILATQQEEQETTHFTAKVRLHKHPPELSSGVRPHLSPDSIVDSAKIYRVYFHGPAYQVLERAWWDGTHLIGEMSINLPFNHQPESLPTQIAPRLIELCFQTAGLWEMGANSKLGLPTRVDQVVAWPMANAVPHPLYAVVTPHPEHGTFDAEVVDADGNRYLRVDGYHTTALPAPIDPEVLTSLQQLITPEGVTVPSTH
ncbi:beta-ketoacyl synthase [Candidatus Koribacter versatilis Ellin345]|uniref:Beta-ketoacyl synthase n=1 Tax=Koribacter versatilis (strain Ellin345) TaxID=204669 RepID=Q1IUI0_KORVE|nr:type I polyketide synthase [Candidatus Koribacter versatilis]ABF39470.1 beta-ketoacyl synthase [Candidatus Koribacter versatilis Ellin345]